MRATLVRVLITLGVLSATLGSTGVVAVLLSEAIRQAQVERTAAQLEHQLGRADALARRALAERSGAAIAAEMGTSRSAAASALGALSSRADGSQASALPAFVVTARDRLVARLVSEPPVSDLEPAYRSCVSRAEALIREAQESPLGPTPPLEPPLDEACAPVGEDVAQVRAAAERNASTLLRTALLATIGIISTIGAILVAMIWMGREQRSRGGRRADSPAGELRRVLQATPGAVGYLDTGGAIRAATDAAGEVLGCPLQELPGARLLQFVSGMDGKVVERFLEDCRRDPKGAHQIECRFRHAPDRWYLLQTFGNKRRDDPEIDGVMLRLTDISERKAAEEALRESSEMLRTLTQASPLAIAIEDTSGAVKLWNPASESLVGWPASQILGGPNCSIPAGRAEEHAHLRARVLEGDAFTGLEVQRLRKDGALIEASMSTAPLRDATGTICGVMEFLTDITERKQLEAQLRQAQKMEAVGRLAGGVAHDFNNLLTAILGRAGLLARRLEAMGRPDANAWNESQACRMGIEEIQRAAERAAKLTEQLLAFSRNQVLQPTVLDLNAVLVDLEDMLRRLIGEDVDLQVVQGRDLPMITADSTQIAQVIMNLAVNARDAMPKGGKLTIETTEVTLDELYARKHMPVIPGHYVMLAVSDNGIGMDRDTQARIFEPFFTTKEQGKGTGLGLATVYGIVKQSGGYIWVYSEPGLGTTFKLYLPSVQRTAGSPEEDVRPPQPPQIGSETVLLVEDEEMVRALVRQVLTWYGYQVLEATNGEEALAVAERHRGPIHLLLTDIVMPGMSAADMVAQLRPKRPDTKILYMSGYTDHAVVRHNLLEANAAFLQKPFAPDRLAHKVREVLGGPSAARSAVPIASRRHKRFQVVH